MIVKSEGGETWYDFSFNSYFIAEAKQIITYTE